MGLEASGLTSLAAVGEIGKGVLPKSAVEVGYVFVFGLIALHSAINGLMAMFGLIGL